MTKVKKAGRRQNVSGMCLHLCEFGYRCLSASIALDLRIDGTNSWTEIIGNRSLLRVEKLVYSWGNRL